MTEKQKLNNENQRKLTIEFVNSLKTMCAKCGEKRKYTLDFHHIDHKNKAFGISWGINARGRKSLEREIKKCVCLCKNCHAEFHYLYGETPDNPIEALNEFLRGDDNAQFL